VFRQDSSPRQGLHLRVVSPRPSEKTASDCPEMGGKNYVELRKEKWRSQGAIVIYCSAVALPSPTHEHEGKRFSGGF